MGGMTRGRSGVSAREAEGEEEEQREREETFHGRARWKLE